MLKIRKEKVVNIKKIVSLMCMVSLVFTNLFFCSAAPVNAKKRVIFVGDISNMETLRISSRVKRYNGRLVKEESKARTYTKFNVGDTGRAKKR